MRISRIVVALFALLFAVVGLGFWVAPTELGRRFFLEAVGVDGFSTLRADLGGLFVGAAILFGMGVWRKRDSLLTGAAVVVSAVIAGRVIGFVAHGWSRATLLSLAIEVVAVAALVTYARALRASGTKDPRGMGRRTLAVGAIVAVAVGVVGGVLLLPGVQQWLFERGANRATATVDSAPFADDAMRVGICGSSAPLASALRAKACVAVFAAGKMYLVDVGPESVENLLLWNIPLSQVGGVLLTHFHSDHIGDLGELNLQTWAQGRPAPLAVYGGPGVEQVVDGFNQAYRLDQGYRTAHHTARVMPPETWPMVAHTVELPGPASPEKSRTGVVLDEGGLRITAIEVDHTPITPAYAYRFDYKGRAVVVTGDTKFHPPLAVAAAGADVLVSEAIARPMVEALQRGSSSAGRDRVATIMHDIQDYHISPQEAAGIANRAHVKLLVFYHLLPSPDAFLTRRVFARGVDDVRHGDWVTADDGSLYTLPIGTNDVVLGRIGP